jgi:hypothetical protein
VVIGDCPLAFLSRCLGASIWISGLRIQMLSKNALPKLSIILDIKAILVEADSIRRLVLAMIQ